DSVCPNEDIIVWCCLLSLHVLRLCFPGFITLLVLVLIGIAVLVLSAKTMRKGSYRTNEKGNDEESNAALQAED
uniref:Uncharacterized protein n=1 Tax=Myripristis murdjan TaxID=586833 RepID=A0A668AMU4_9TELE